MTTAQYKISRLDAALAGYGQTVTLQRTTQDADGAVTVVASADCPAKVSPYTPQDLEAGEVADISVIISPSSLATFGIPKRDDRIIIEDDDPSNIEQIGTKYHGGQLVRVNLLCRG
jgi:hypothetical protein